jgi:hypothetical protein
VLAVPRRDVAADATSWRTAAILLLAVCVALALMLAITLLST